MSLILSVLLFIAVWMLLGVFWLVRNLGEKNRKDRWYDTVIFLPWLPWLLINWIVERKEGFNGR